jgi:nicotinamidase/pyrazinamidase
MERNRIGILIVDPQNDFTSEFKKAALPAPDGAQIKDPINRIIARAREKRILRMFSRDQHPADSTIHFEKWGPHCIPGTYGAEFIPGLDLEGAIIFSKGTKKDEDIYSSFEGKNDQALTLDEFLKQMGIATIVIAGLATEYCVKETVLDALKLNYNVQLVTDGIKAVNKFTPDDGKNALEEMSAKGAILKISDEILATL